ncbi:MAG: TonB-dependent receptor [Bacteroidaceae bacterium]|nr:TonB-dependent receptor [Bacteroidaceae bacterium]
MNKFKIQNNKAVVWRQFAHKGYSAFASLHRQIRIGVLSIATLTVAAAAQAQGATITGCLPFGGDIEGASSSGELDEDHDLAELTVSGTMAPLSQLQAARIVCVLTRQEIEQAAAQSVNDLLKLVTGVDVWQRGGFGIQTDISIDGGTFDQVTLLLNGIDIGNPQTGHLSADFPVSICDIERIEVLEGAASRVYGGQSFGGAINIVTRHDREQSIELAGRGGSFGTAEGEARLSFALKRFSNRISGGGGRSDGGTLNSGWQKGQLYYQGDYEDDALRLDWQFGFSKKSYGANTFYSANYPNQYERNQRLMTSISAETKGRFHFTPQVFWNRSWDNFELIHDSSFGENFHRTDVYGLKAGGHFNWRLGKTAVSALMRHEGILSTNLGRDLEPEQYVAINGQWSMDNGQCYYTRSDDRITLSFTLEHNILLQHWTVSAGLMASMTSSIDHRFRFYPGIDIAYRPSSNWKVLFSYNKGFRLPTFTELYYKSPTHEGNRDLKPEHNHSFSIGAEYRWGGVESSVRGFYHRGTQMIDWVMYAPDDIYHTAAFNLDNVGVQVQGKIFLSEFFGRDTWVRSFSAGYTFIHQNKHDADGVVKSNVAMEYLRHKFVASLSHRIVGHLSMSWDFRWQDRVGSYLSGGELIPYHPYAMLDAKILWSNPFSHPSPLNSRSSTHTSYLIPFTSYISEIYLQATNITNHHYYDLGSVPQPGIWLMAGAKFNLNFKL